MNFTASVDVSFEDGVLNVFWNFDDVAANINNFFVAPTFGCKHHFAQELVPISFQNLNFTVFSRETIPQPPLNQMDQIKVPIQQNL